LLGTGTEKTGKGAEMNTVREFESRFESEIRDMLILTKAAVGGGAVVGNYLMPSLDFIASIDLHTGKLSRETGRLEWLIKNERGKIGWGYDFRQFEIYHIRARKNIPVKPVPPQALKTFNNCYMVVELLKDVVADPRLEAIREEVSKPVVLEDVLGVFTLEREYSWFSGEIDWLGKTCGVSLDTDEEDGDTADHALDTLHRLCEKQQDWDERFRRYAASELTDLANEWLEEREEEEGLPASVTEKELAEKLTISELTVFADGSMTLYYLDEDEIFCDHSIVIDTDSKGEFLSADLAG